MMNMSRPCVLALFALSMAAWSVGYAGDSTAPIFTEDFEQGPSGILMPVGVKCKAELVTADPCMGKSGLRMIGSGSPSEWMDWRSSRIPLAETRTYDVWFCYRGNTKGGFDVKYWCFDRHGQLIGYAPNKIDTVESVPESWDVFRRRILANSDAASVMISIETFNLDGTLDVDNVALAPVPLDPALVSDMEMPWLWKPAFPETTVCGEEKRVKEGQFSLAFKIKVDHKGGEKNYPIGWPHVAWSPDPPLDWSGFSRLTFWVYTETSRDKLPERALATICRQVRGRELSTLVPGLRKNEWVRVSLPLPKEPLTEVRYVEFHIAESDYNDGDEVAFYIDDMRLEK